MTDQIERCACSISRRTSRTLTQMYDRALAPSGLLSTQYSLLRKLEDGPKSVSEIAALLELDRTTLTRNLSILEERDLIRLSVGQDRRERRATLTPGGRRSLERAIPLWNNAQQALKNHLGVEKYAIFLELLDETAAMETHAL